MRIKRALKRSAFVGAIDATKIFLKHLLVAQDCWMTTLMNHNIQVPLAPPFFLPFVLAFG